MNNTQFGAELNIGGQESAVSAEQKVQSLRASMVDLAVAFEKGEIGQQEYLAAVKELAPSLRANEQAARAIAAAAREQSEAEAAGAAAQRANVEALAEEYRALAAAHQAAAQSDLDEQLERESMALQHETEMLAHAERELHALKAAEDTEIASLGRSVQAHLAASDAVESLTSDRTAATIALAKETDFERLDASLKAREAQAARDLADAEEDAAAAHRHEAEMLGIRTTKTGQYGSAVVQVGGGTRNLGLAALEASRGLEDLQYGVGGLINNLPNLAMYLGGPAGVGTAVSGLAVGSYVLAKNWDTLTGAFSNTAPIRDAAGRIQELDERIKELEGKKIRLVVDQVQLDEAKRKLDELKKGLAEWEAQQHHQSTEEAEAGKITQELLDNSDLGAPEITAQLTDRQKQQNLANSQALKQAQADQVTAGRRVQTAQEGMSAAHSIEEIETASQALSQATASLADAQQRESEARNAAETSARSQVGEQLRQLREGHGQDQALARGNVVAGLQGIGQGQLAGQIAGTTPQGLRRGDEEDREFNRRMDQAKEAGGAQAEKEKKLAKAHEQQIDQLAKESDEQFKAEEDARVREAKARRKIGDAEFKGLQDQLEDEIKETEARQKAEAGRIVGQVGKDEARRRIGAALEENPNADPEQIAVKVAGQLAAAFRQMGASQGGALIAAQRLVGNAGFQVSRQQAFGAARQASARPQPARRRATKAKPKPVKQASVLPAVQGTQQAVAATQAAVAAGQAKVAKLESNVQQLIRDAVRLRNRAVEQAPTALNSGSSTA